MSLLLKVEESNNNKKRKLEKKFSKFTIEILYEIAKYFKNIKDFLSFANVNKYFYENLLLSTNSLLTTQLFNDIFENTSYYINLSDKLPQYVYNKLKEININYDKDTIYLLNNFTNLERLTINEMREGYIFEDKLNKLIKIKFVNSNLNLNTFKNLKQLTILNCDNCVISLDCFNELINLKDLTIISYAHNNLIFDVKSLQNLINLEHLHFQTKYRGDLFEYIGNLTNLKQLSIFSVYNSSFLQKLINLESLDILGSNFKDKDFINLKKLKNLYIDNEDQLTGTCFTQLNHLEKLKFNLSCIKELKYLKNIKELNIVINEDNDKLIKEIPPEVLPNIVEIGIADLKNDGAILLKLINLKSLEAVNSTISDKYFVNLKQLEHLEIHDCRKITGECLYCLQNLKTLRTSDTKIKDSHLFQLKQLETLEVESCKNITGEFLLHLNKLKNLTIMGINIKQEYLELLKNMKNVKTDVFEEDE
ncbi:hypothetical protein ABK040_006372 [Willaertia magna]